MAADTGKTQRMLEDVIDFCKLSDVGGVAVVFAINVGYAKELQRRFLKMIRTPAKVNVTKLEVTYLGCKVLFRSQGMNRSFLRGMRAVIFHDNSCSIKLGEP